ncbi:kinase-related protein [Aspergillus sclerotiicarbonarius CBS 121057]|uniref:Kinase-related protein n=1 Tax=Aspergillus sclerotiicarbonarius (strain CBS 121057 / IBT 28362) TaxID=1448318 RepID=A0A319E5U5_ASPSB|nr:kinase-related protein [Aspergillus sclerotiicarbonarius CBS 121057]
METQVNRLALQCLDDLALVGSGGRVIVGIAGVPGSGKTTLAAAVASKINELWGEQEHQGTKDTGCGAIAVAIPMDGFHYTRPHLASMENAAEAIHRRGAAFTFDADGFYALVDSLRSVTCQTIYAPSFGHEIKDPVPKSIPILPESRIVLIEGNYCALDRDPWRAAAALMNRLWYVDAPSEVTHKRLAKRHLASGIVADETEAWERAAVTDELNAKEIRENLLPVDEVIRVSATM